MDRDEAIAAPSGQSASEEKKIIESGHQNAAAIDSDADVAVAAISTGQFVRWNLKTGREVSSFAGPRPQYPAAFALSRDGKLVATAHGDTVWVLDTTDGSELLQCSTLGTVNIASLAFPPDGTRLASGLTDGSILVWAVVPRGPNGER